MLFDESKHPRAGDGKFTEGKGDADKIREAVKKFSDSPKEDMSAMGVGDGKNKLTSLEKIVEVNLDTDIQKKLKNATTPKERQELAFRYIMDNLRGRYPARDGRIVAIERVGADKMTYQDHYDKLRVCPALAEMIKVGEFDHISKAEDKLNKRFEEFAYYKVRVKMDKEVYNGILNVGIRKDGSSTLYDLRPFYKERKK